MEGQRVVDQQERDSGSPPELRGTPGVRGFHIPAPGCSGHEETLSQAALQFAEIRWGQEQALAQKKENSIARVPESAPELARAERVR